MDEILGQPLTALPGGRIFVRGARGTMRGRDWRVREDMRDAVAIVGVVEVPASTDFERLHACRINSALWLDAQWSRRLHDWCHGDIELAETPVAQILASERFPAQLLPDACEMFVRRSMIEHAKPLWRWACVGAVLPVRPPDLPVDGFYDLTPGDGLRLVQQTSLQGEALCAAFRECMWGPEGRFGLATSMEPTAFLAWLPLERARNRSKDPDFAAFQDRLERAVGPEQFVYTKDDQERRSALADAIIREVAEAAQRRSAQERLEEMQEMAAALRQRG